MAKHRFSTKLRVKIHFEVVEERDTIAVHIYLGKLRANRGPIACWMPSKGVLSLKFAQFETLKELEVIPQIDAFCNKIHKAWESGK